MAEHQMIDQMDHIVGLGRDMAAAYDLVRSYRNRLAANEALLAAANDTIGKQDDLYRQFRRDHEARESDLLRLLRLCLPYVAANDALRCEIERVL